jgi:hypothetical protein
MIIKSTMNHFKVFKIISKTDMKYWAISLKNRQPKELNKSPQFNVDNCSYTLLSYLSNISDCPTLLFILKHRYISDI